MEPESKSKSGLHSLKQWGFRLAASSLIFFALAAVELALRIVSPSFLVPGPDEKPIPAGLPYFRIDRQAEYQVYTASQYYSPWDHRFRFCMPKPRGVFRIFSLGGSAVNGASLGNPGAFSRWLSVMLSAVDLSTNYEVINSGQPGFPSSEVLALEKQVLEAGPDLVIVYLGNNEFLWNREQAGRVRWPEPLLVFKYYAQKLWLLRLIQLAWHPDSRPWATYAQGPEGMRRNAARYLQSAAKNTWDRDHYQWVMDQFRLNLETMVDLAKARGTRIILCTVAVNLRDWEPHGSYHRADFPESLALPWDRAVQAGKSAFTKGNFGQARADFLQAAALDDTPASLNFFLGHCLLKLGDPESAYRHFLAAADRDSLRDRAGSDLNAMVREVAKAKGVSLLDLQQTFKERASDGIPGDDLFLDNVHPNLEGHRIIAESLLERMIANGWVPAQGPVQETAFQAAEAYQGKMPVAYLFNSYYSEASWNAFLGRFLHAQRWAEKALEYQPEQPRGLELRSQLDSILSRYSAHPSLPWGEVDFAQKDEGTRR